MAGKLKGITLEIGGSTKPLINALREPNKDISNLQSKLKQINQMLKFDPSNTELLAKKQKLLGQQVEQTESKLKLLKQSQSEFIKSSGDLTSKGYLDLQQEIQKTESNLKRLKSQQSGVSAELEAFGVKMSKVGDKMEVAGKKMIPVTGAIAATGGASMVAWNEIDQAMDGIAKGTGATGKKLEEFQEIAKNVYKDMPIDIDQVGIAVADLNTRMGKTGDDLEHTSEQFLKFAKINNIEIGPAIEGVSKAMADANIDFSETDKVLDMLTATSQSSGISVDALTSLLSQNGAVMRGLGFDTETTISMLATFEKNGVNTSTVLTGMKFAMKECGKSGKNGNAEMQKFFKGVQDGSITSADAIELFGSRAGATIFQYAQEGKLNFEEMAKVVESSNGQLEASYLATLDPIDQLKVAMNNIKITGSELAESLQSTLAPIIASLVEHLQAFATWFENLSPKTKSMIVHIGLIIAAIGPALLILGKLFKSVQKIIQIIKMVQTAIQFLNVASLGPTTLIIAGIIAAIIALIAIFKNWDEICKWFQEQWQAFIFFIHGKWISFKDWFLQIGENIVGFFRELPGNLKQFGLDMIQKLVDGIEAKLGLPKGSINRLISNIKGIFADFLTNPFKWGADMLRGFADGIMHGFHWVQEKVNSVTSWIKRHLHFSVPDEGPLSDADKWGPDFMQLLADGIDKNKSKVFDKINEVANGMRMNAIVSSEMTQTLANNQVVHVYNHNVLELDGKQIFDNTTKKATEYSNVYSAFKGA